jgi:hypothetical protein
VVSKSWEDREEIIKKEVNLFCWKRPVDFRIVNYLKEIQNERPERISQFISLIDLHRQLELCRSKWDSEKRGDEFWNDVANLTSDFLRLSERSEGQLHLRIVEDDACAKFHTDRYKFRLFSTYLGPGTEWLPEMATNRSALGKDNSRIVRDEFFIQRMEAFEVGILKGQYVSEKQGIKGIVHRSPEISKTKEKRVILRVDV